MDFKGDIVSFSKRVVKNAPSTSAIKSVSNRIDHKYCSNLDKLAGQRSKQQCERLQNCIIQYGTCSVPKEPAQHVTIYHLCAL